MALLYLKLTRAPKFKSTSYMVDLNTKYQVSPPTAVLLYTYYIFYFIIIPRIEIINKSCTRVMCIYESPKGDRDKGDCPDRFT